MKKIILFLGLCILMLSCDYQEKPTPPIPMEKVVLQEFIQNECCENALYRAKRLSNGTMVSLQIRKEFHSGDTVLVQPKNLRLN